MKDIGLKSKFNEQEAVLRELIRAVKDVMMLRWAKIRVERKMRPAIYNMFNSGERHNEVVSCLGGMMFTEVNVII